MQEISEELEKTKEDHGKLIQEVKQSTQEQREVIESIQEQIDIATSLQGACRVSAACMYENIVQTNTNVT